jgi:hypothetical protein
MCSPKCSKKRGKKIQKTILSLFSATLTATNVAYNRGVSSKNAVAVVRGATKTPFKNQKPNPSKIQNSGE